MFSFKRKENTQDERAMWRARREAARARERAERARRIATANDQQWQAIENVQAAREHLERAWAIEPQVFGGADTKRIAALLNELEEALAVVACNAAEARAE